MQKGIFTHQDFYGNLQANAVAANNGVIASKFKDTVTKFKETVTKFKETVTKFKETVTKFKETVNKFKETEVVEIEILAVASRFDFLSQQV